MKAKVHFVNSTIVLVFLVGLSSFAYGQQFSDWTAPVNLGPPVNTPLPDAQPFVTKDGLSLYFVHLEGNYVGAPQDIWVAKRNSVQDSWGNPQRLGPAINSPLTEAGPFITVDGHWMYFSSNRVGGFGRQDIYVSRRYNKREDLPTEPSGGWQEAQNIGDGVNTNFNEQAPMVFEDEETGITTLYFHSARPTGLGGNDIYASTLQPDGTFGPPVLVPELSTPYNDELPMISRNGLEMFLTSDRPGSILDPETGLPSYDLWVSERASTLDPWSEPVNLGPVVNTPSREGRPDLSFDGTTLWFHSAFPYGVFDIWKTTRTKLAGEQ